MERRMDLERIILHLRKGQDAWMGNTHFYLAADELWALILVDSPILEHHITNISTLRL
ncbi:hypothetical protein EYZ11_011269 [Aspergillus tanneri]|uniref:Uncharacterized protein n=1 Tax=Aspergillus tanneri TaxID=1220188 RepID=A0A4V3UN02_9EURO|nr:hypothetical protein EYZ11_011269 [Aspergillus tanneri]